MLQETGVPAESLTLEVTESSVMSDPDRIIAILTRLDELHVRLSVDDFGTGYSSLSYLQRLPVREVKIDRSFVMSLGQRDSDLAIVRTIVDLGSNLGLTVVAEASRTPRRTTGSRSSAATSRRATCSAGRCPPPRSSSGSRCTTSQSSRRSSATAEVRRTRRLVAAEQRTCG
jgi:predicted signal transduction protein with EAL and GGDEF domain